MNPSMTRIEKERRRAWKKGQAIKPKIPIVVIPRSWAGYDPATTAELRRLIGKVW